MSVHIIFPAICIGLASFLAVLEGLWLRTKDPVYKKLYSFWSRIFAIGFGMGVVSGMVMSYEFGTNWAGFSNIAGNVTGPLLAYEVLTAFFLEAGFLGVMLFGWHRVGPRMHFFATVPVVLGTLISTFWILASNSFMQTPQGYCIQDCKIEPLDWWTIIFNPSFPYRIFPLSSAAFIVAAGGVWHLLAGRRDPASKRIFSMALWILLLLTPLQIVIGDAHRLNTRAYQPAKISLKRRYQFIPFRLAIFLIFPGHSGLLNRIWPNIIPPSLTTWEASSGPSSQRLTLVGIAIILPVILIYTYLQYRAFRGKVREGDPGYH